MVSSRRSVDANAGNFPLFRRQQSEHHINGVSTPFTSAKLKELHTSLGRVNPDDKPTVKTLEPTPESELEDSSSQPIANHQPTCCPSNQVCGAINDKCI